MRALEVWTGHGSVCTASGECPDEQDEQCAPPAGREAAAEQEHGEEGGGEQLELVQHLVRRGVEVRGREVEQVVLHEVDERRREEGKSAAPVNHDLPPKD